MIYGRIKVRPRCINFGTTFFDDFQPDFDLTSLVVGGYGYGAEPTFVYCGEHRVVVTYSFSVENVLNVKSKISAFQNNNFF